MWQPTDLHSNIKMVIPISGLDILVDWKICGQEESWAWSLEVASTLILSQMIYALWTRNIFSMQLTGPLCLLRLSAMATTEETSHSGHTASFSLSCSIVHSGRPCTCNNNCTSMLHCIRNTQLYGFENSHGFIKLISIEEQCCLFPKT